MRKLVSIALAAAAALSAVGAFADDVQMTATRINYEPGARYVVLGGNIDEGTAPALREFFKKNRRVTHVDLLPSFGVRGKGLHAVQVAQELVKREVSTIATGSCTGQCPVVLAAGKSRFGGLTSKLSWEPSAVDMEREVVVAFFDEMGVSDVFVKEVLKSKDAQKLSFSGEYAYKANLFTDFIATDSENSNKRLVLEKFPAKVNILSYSEFDANELGVHSIRKSRIE